MGGIYWLASYPKSGNTWFRLVLANYLRDSNEPISINQLNTGTIASSRLWIDDVSGFDTSDMTADEIKNIRPDIYRWSAREGDVGYHKIHDAYSHTRNGKPIIDNEASRGIIYIVRNPLDVAPSLANHINCSIDQAIERMADEAYSFSGSQGRLSSQVQQHLGSWSHHVMSWINQSETPLHIVRYEDMLDQPESAFGRAFRFLGLSPKASVLQKAICHSSFTELQAQEDSFEFRERPARSKRFFRSGRSRTWETELTEKQIGSLTASHGEVMELLGYALPL